MKTFQFTAVSSCRKADLASLSARMFEAGCDDATVSLRKGVVIVEFDREDKNFYHALKSAWRTLDASG